MAKTEFFEGKGKCLCGNISIHAKQVKQRMGACHCTMCLKWGGGPLLSTDSGQEVSFQGKEFVSVFDSSEWADRGFCKECGTHLFYRLKQTEQYIIPIHLFDNIHDFIFDHQVCIDEKPSYYSFMNKTQKMTKAELFAMYT